MLKIAIKMLLGDHAKYVTLLIGIAFTAFLVTFALSYFSGFLTQGFSLISENSATDIWVMDPSVTSVEQTINMPDSALDKVRNVKGVSYATPLSLDTINVRIANGNFQTFEVIGVDDASLTGAPNLSDGHSPDVLFAPNAAIIDAGGTSGKLETPINKSDQWPQNGVHLNVPTRELGKGDELLVNGHNILVVGHSDTFPRFPPRPLIYTTYSTAVSILPKDERRLTFILVSVKAGMNAEKIAANIQQQTGYRARTSMAFKKDTVNWYLINSEDVGDMAAMLILAMAVGFGATGVLLFMFTYENLKQYAVLKAMGAMPSTLIKMIFTQVGLCAVLGTGIGVGVCAIVGEALATTGYPFRMMWFTPLVGILGVLIVSLTAALISARPVLKLAPGIVFSSR